MRKHLFGIIGVLFLIVTIFMAVSSINDNKECTESVQGTVIDYEISVSTSDGREVTYYHPVFRYRAGGSEYTERFGIGYGNDVPYEIGSVQELKYDPADPSHFIIAGNKDFVKGIIMSGIASLICIAVEVMQLLGVQFPLGSKGAARSYAPPAANIRIPKSVQRIIPLIFAGICAIVIGIGLKPSFNGFDGFKETTGVISSVGGENSVMVEYVVSGREYEAPLDSYSFTYKEGKKVNLLYNPADPLDVHTGYGSIWWIVALAGAVVSLGGIAVLVIIFKRQNT